MSVENWDRVKWARSAYVSNGSTITINLTQWDGTAMAVEDFNLSMIVATLIYGTPSTMKVGTTAGGDEILIETDMSSFEVGIPQCISVDEAMESGENTLYFTIPTGNYSIDCVFIQRIGA